MTIYIGYPDKSNGRYSVLSNMKPSELIKLASKKMQVDRSTVTLELFSKTSREWEQLKTPLTLKNKDRLRASSEVSSYCKSECKKMAACMCFCNKGHNNVACNLLCRLH